MRIIDTCKINVLKILPKSIQTRIAIRNFRKYGYSEEMWGGGIYGDNLANALNVNLTKEESENYNTIRKITNDIIKCYLTLEATPEEYFAFSFREKNTSDRMTFLTNMLKDKIIIEKIGWPRIMRLRDKCTTYELLSDFFRRDICFIKSNADKERYLVFVSKNSRYFVKPIDGMCGKRTSIMSGDHFDALLSSGNWIIEELITQVPEMAQFNDTSINTVRLPTFYKDGAFSVLAPFFRTGRKGAIVDNGGAGGIFAALDADTGEIISDGVNENNKTYKCHPDSNVPFRGFKIPYWTELLVKARQAHSVLADQQYIAWDFALTPEGWYLVEANSMGQFLWQYATKKGVKQEFLKLME